MKKQAIKTGKAVVAEKKRPAYRLDYLLILLAYAIITLITPNLKAFDSNGPIFLSLALLNLLTFLYLLTQKDIRADAQQYWSFFRNKTGLAYTLFLLMMLISFAKAINLSESVISFLKYFTVFAAAYNLTIILRRDKKHLDVLSLILVILLITDCFTVFYNIFLYISHQIGTIYEIKSVYSNKNILAAAIFIKIPFALWFASFGKGWQRKLGFFSSFIAVLAILYMSSRAFYLGLIFLFLFYGLFLLVQQLRSRQEGGFLRLGYFAGTILLAFLLFSGIQYFFFPKTADVYNQSFTNRLSSITSGETSSQMRLLSWERSGKLIKENPVLGVGAGNWKIAVLQYEGPAAADFTYMVRNHNDFLEITAETGIIGGLLFVSLFVLMLFNFGRALFRRDSPEDALKYLFLPAFGLFCYSFDAFFNFPADRPEIQVLFAIFLAAGIAYSPPWAVGKAAPKRWSLAVFVMGFLVLMPAAVYILLLNVNSLKLQRIMYEDALKGQLTVAASTFTQGFPRIPEMSILGEPVAVIKARYLINEEKYAEALNLLRHDKTSPYDGRREYFLALAFSKSGQNDSALFYGYKALALKPRFDWPLGLICRILEERGKQVQAIGMLEDFVGKEKEHNKGAWLYLSASYVKNGQLALAARTLDSAALYFPQDSAIQQQQAEVQRDILIQPHRQLYDKAMETYTRRDYPEALKYLSEFISKEPGIPLSYARRAFCYYYAREYEKCLADLQMAMAGGNLNPDYLNLRGTIYQMLGKNELACADFRLGAEKGSKEGAANLAKFCR